MVQTLALLAILISLWPSIFCECIEELNDETCTYDTSCTGTLMNFGHQYISNQYNSYNGYNQYSNNYGQTYYTEKCSTISGVYDDRIGNYWYKINLRLNMTSQQSNEIMMFPGSSNNGIGHDFTKCNIIISLDLSQQNLIELTEFPILRSMKHLIKFNISRNMISEAILFNINKLPSLEEIDYSHNKIEKIVLPDNNAYIFTNLKKINLSYNKIMELPPAIFENFKELEFLDLSQNFIDKLDPMVFEGVKKLLQLYMSHNKIDEINSSLLRFSNLKELNLDHNEIQIIKSNDLKNLIKLQKIDLSFNAINKIETLAFNDMTCLHTISLSNNLLQNLDTDVFNTTVLTTVDLSNNNIHTLPQHLLKGKSVSFFSIESNTLQGSLQKGMFEGLEIVSRLDLSHQNLIMIEDNAFYGMENIETLLLNNNNIAIIGNNAFQNLQTLIELNLSNNKITSINFIINDFVSLHLLTLSWNCITEIERNQMVGLSSLLSLDVSNNNISRLEPNAFSSLGNLTIFKVHNNQLNGEIEKNTFKGLNSLPILNISSNLLNSIKNDSFHGMKDLRELNVSHSKITEIQYNAFSYTGNIEEIDISYNKVEILSLNLTFLFHLRNLLINNNYIKHIEQSTFAGLRNLNKILISHNYIETINKNAFVDQSKMTYLDMSYNKNLTFDVSLFDNSKSLHHLLLMGTPLDSFNFTNIAESAITQLSVSYSTITNIKKINIKRLMKLEDLCLSNNQLTKLEIGSFSNMSNLNRLDVSFNKISAIQPGVFKDNNVLTSLNISHNSLLFLSYGIFRGLRMLNTLDISYNNINNLARERFYELGNMRILIADYNKIEYISAEELPHLNVLSIGGNPLPCNLLVNLQNSDSNLSITAIIKDESSENALLGITCRNRYSYKHKVNITPEPNNIVNDIKEILETISNNIVIDKQQTESKSIFEQFDNSLAKNNKKLSEVSSSIINQIDSTSNNTYSLINKIETEAKTTNILLEKIVKVLNTINSVRRTPVTPAFGNMTETNIINYINNVKQDLEDAALIEKQNVLNKINDEITIIKSLLPKKEPDYDKLAVNHTRESGSLATELCVGFILIIMILSFVYKLYKCRFAKSRHTSSTLQFNDNSIQL